MEKKSIEIKLPMLKDLQQELKKLNMQWLPLLVKQIQDDETIEEQFRQINERKAYNVFNGIVTNGAWKLTLYREGKKLKEILQGQVLAAIKE